MKHIFNFIQSRNKFLALILILNLFIHFPFLNLPPCSIHVWRQCNTLAVARNFYEEDMNILKPRVDRRLNSDGVTGMQFPAYEFGVACLYKIFGDANWVARYFSLCLFSLAIIFLFDLVLMATGSALAAAIASWSLCFSPELFYHSINALPDIMALSAGLGGLFFFLKWNQSQQNKYFLISLLLMTLSGLVKIQYLMFGGVIAVLVIRNFIAKKYSAKNIVMLLCFAIISIGITISWYVYAQYLIETSNLRDFGIDFRPAQSWSDAKKILSDNFISDIPELMLNFAGTALFLTGVIAFFISKKWKHSFFQPLILVGLLYSAYHIIELNQMDVHQYYMIPSMLIFVFVISYGGKFLFDKKLFAVLLLILIAQPILACVRILPARWLNKNKAVPIELYDASSRKQLQDVVPDSALCIAGPDESGCIYFYFLHKKGFGFDRTEQLTQKISRDDILYINYCKALGATYIYTSDSTISQNEILKPDLGNEIKRVGSFRVIRLKN